MPREVRQLQKTTHCAIFIIGNARINKSRGRRWIWAWRIRMDALPESKVLIACCAMKNQGDRNW
jgi:hypothetical protein